VTISIAADPLIQIAGISPVINSLTSAEQLRVGSNATLTVGTANCSASVQLGGGTIQGGTWTFSGGAALRIVTNIEGRLNNPVINGDIIFVDNSARLRVLAGTTYSAMRFRASSQSVAFEPGTVINSPILIDQGFATGYVELFANGTLTVGPSAVLGMLAGTSGTFSIGNGFWYSATTGLTIDGTVSNASIGGVTINPNTLAVSASGVLENTGSGTFSAGVRSAPFTWSSFGTIRASAGQLSLLNSFTNSNQVQASGTGRIILANAWTNAGTLSLVGNARIDLGGTFTTASIGTISRGGGGTQGVLAVTGVWDNTGSTFALNSTSGSVLVEGTITGGTITSADGAVLRGANSSNSQLNGVTYGGELRLDVSNARVIVRTGTSIGGVRVSAQSAGITMDAGMTVNFPVVIESNSSIGTFGIDVRTAGQLTWGSGASISSVGSWTGTVLIGRTWWGTTATQFTNNGTIALSGANRTLEIGGNTFSNSSGSTISVAAGTGLVVGVTGTDENSWTNAGTISATNGSLTFQDRWSVPAGGTVVLNNSTASLEGRFETPSLLRFSRTGGSVRIIGRLDNTGQSTVLDAATGSWRLDGGTVVGGTLAFSGGNRLIISGLLGNRIDGVGLQSELVLDENSSRVVFNVTTTAVGVRLTSSNAGLLLDNNAVINYPVISDSVVQTSHAVESSVANATLTIAPGGSVTTTPGSRATLYVGEQFWGSTSASLINQGTIASSANARELRVRPTLLTNTGIIRGRNGANVIVAGLSGNTTGFDVADTGTTLQLNGNYALTGALAVPAGTAVTLRGNWSNIGSISISGGTLVLDGAFSLSNLGSFTNNAGNVVIVGTMNNAAGLTLNAATGSWTLAGGTINGGTIAQTQGSRLLFAPSTDSTLNGVTFDSTLRVSGSSARVRALSTTAPAYALDVNGAGIGFEPGRVLNQTVTVNSVAGNSGIETVGDGSLTLGTSGRIEVLSGSLTIGQFWYSGSRSLEVQGTIVASGGNVTINPTTFTNYDQATRTLSGGTYSMLNGRFISFPAAVARNNATLVLDGANGLPSQLAALAENTGTITLSGGKIASILFAQDASTEFTNRGRLDLSPGSAWRVGSPGRSANFVQDASGVVRFELAGTTPATHGVLRVFGTATLDGKIEAAYVNGFQRACGQLFLVIDANNRVGQFAARDLPPNDESTIFLLFYGGADVRLTVSARADFNEDGFLDFFDFADFVDCFETGVCPPGVTADFDGDGFVDFFDFSEFVFRFEAGCD
jgi:hypothetical protein